MPNKQNDQSLILKDKAELTNQINEFAQTIIEQMKNDNIQITPDNFEVYFYKMLDNEDLKKNIDIINKASIDPAKHQANMEMKVKKSFISIKNMLQLIILVYKNLNTMNRIVCDDIANLEKANSIESKDIIYSFQKELIRLNELLTRHTELLKDDYNGILDTFKSISSNSIYDTDYGIFNRNYLVSVIENEIKNVNKFGHNSTLMLIELQERSLSNIANYKDKEKITKTIANTLIQTSRRSDFVAHFDDNCFALFMQHTNMDNAKQAQDRIAKVLYGIKFDHINLSSEFAFSLVSLDPSLSAEETISDALDKLEQDETEIQTYKRSLGF